MGVLVGALCVSMYTLFSQGKRHDAYKHTHRAFKIAIRFAMFGGNQGHRRP